MSKKRVSKGPFQPPRVLADLVEDVPNFGFLN